MMMEKSSADEKKKGKEKAYSSSSSKDSSDSENGKPKWSKMGALQILNAVKAQVGESISKKNHLSHLNDLMYIEIKLNGNRVKAMIDSGASHNFISKELVAKWDLSTKKSSGQVKVVNSDTQRTSRVAKDIPIQIGEWSGKATLIVAPLDDFEVILGMEFLRSAQGMPIPFLDTLCILGGEKPYMIPVVYQPRKEKPMMLTGMQMVPQVKEGNQVILPRRGKHMEQKIVKDLRPVSLPWRRSGPLNSVPFEDGLRMKTCSTWSKGVAEDIDGTSGGECHGPITKCSVKCPNHVNPHKYMYFP